MKTEKEKAAALFANRDVLSLYANCPLKKIALSSIEFSHTSEVRWWIAGSSATTLLNFYSFDDFSTYRTTQRPSSPHRFLRLRSLRDLIAVAVTDDTHRRLSGETSPAALTNPAALAESRPPGGQLTFFLRPCALVIRHCGSDGTSGSFEWGLFGTLWHHRTWPNCV